MCQTPPTTPQVSAFSSPTPAPTTPEWPSQEKLVSGLTASAPVSDVSAPGCTNGVWPPLRPVSVAQENKPSTLLSSTVKSIDLIMDCTAWRFWTMRQLNDCSTPAPVSCAAKQWFQELAQTTMNHSIRFRVVILWKHRCVNILWNKLHAVFFCHQYYCQQHRGHKRGSRVCGNNSSSSHRPE